MPAEQKQKSQDSSRLSRALDLGLIRRVYGYLIPYKKQFIAAVVITLLIAVVAPVRPWLVQYTLDHQVVAGEYQGLLYMILLMLFFLLAEVGLQYAQTLLTGVLGLQAVCDLRKQVFAHLTRLRMKYFDRTPIGQLVTRCINDLESIAEVFSQGLITISGDILQILAVMSVMLWIDWKLALVSMATLPLLIWATYIFKEAVKSSFTDVRNQVARLNVFLQEHITGMSIVQLFNREEREYKKFEAINRDHKGAHIRSIWYYSIFFPVVEMIAALSLGLLVWWGAKSILQETATLGTLVSFMLYLNMLFRPMRMLADKFNTLQMGIVAADRVFKILDVQQIISDTGTLNPRQVQGHIQFRNIRFAYDPKDGDVLKDISFEAPPGQMLAIVGHTGSGKTSIINILSRFYEYQQGQILLDGKDLRDYKQLALRNHMALVQQEVFLFSDSIYNNITLKDPGISKKEVERAAREIGAWDFICQFPGGLDYNVRERGNALSGGQAQIISFIRVMVQNPSILILDEATSSVDSQTEALIQSALEKLLHGRTSLVIAHRLSTVKNAQRILVLDKGEIAEEGSHLGLLRKDGLYRKLYELQFRSQGLQVA